MSPLAVLGWFVRAPFVLGGAALAGLVVYSHAALLPTFTRAGHEHFWDDVIAYRLKAEGHKSLDQLFAEYDHEFVRSCAATRSIDQFILPSEKSGLAYWVGEAMQKATGEPPQRSPDWLLGQPVMFLFFALPLLVFFGAVTRNLAWAVCGSGRGAELFAERYDAPAWRRAAGGAVVLPVVVALSAVGAAQGLTPDLRRAGFTVLDLTVVAVAQSYLGGAMVRFVRGVIDAAFLAARIDPEATVWDDVLAVAVTGPTLVLLYGNPPVGILGDLAAGVGPPLVLKAWRRWRVARAAGPLDAAIVPDGGATVARNWLTAVGTALVGFVMLACCGWGGSLRHEAIDAGPTRLAAAELEARPPGPKERWVLVDDGYLFWPLLTAVPYPNEPDVVDRYVVPVTSAATRDEWLAEYRKAADASYFTPGHRLLVSFPRVEFERLFPVVRPGELDPERPWVAHRVEGRLEKLTDQSPAARKVVRTGGAVEKKVVLIMDGQGRERGTWFLSAFMLVGFVAMIPPPLRLLLWLFRPQRRARSRAFPVSGPSRPRRRRFDD